MRKILIILFIIVVNFSCSNNDSDVIPIANCIFTDPTQDLVWLKDRIADIETNTDLDDIRKYLYINQSTYLGGPVFISGNCCPVCNTVSSVFDCKGELLGTIGTGENNIHPDLLEDDKLIWSPETFECTFTAD